MFDLKRKIISWGVCISSFCCFTGFTGVSIYNFAEITKTLKNSELSKPNSGNTDTESDQQSFTSGEDILTFTFNGVGDNLLHDPIFVYHEEDTGSRDYQDIYALTRKYTMQADLAYINQETVCAGDKYGLSSYPNFNGPLEMLDTLAEIGYDWLSLSSNHSMDVGAEALTTEIDYLDKQYKEIKYTGVNKTEKASEQPVVLEVNGVKVGLCGFTYGLNGYEVPSDKPWLVDVYKKDSGEIDYDLIDERLEALNEVSDVQFVAMHWGVEYDTTPTEEQKALVKYLNKKGVEVIIGTHPHVIQPVELYEGEDQETLVYYSLGNFLSSQDNNYTMIGGMADFRVNYNTITGETTFDEIKFTPTITWISEDLRRYKTTTIHEYTDEMAETHYITKVKNQFITVDYVQNYVKDIMGNPKGIDIVLF